MTPEVICFIIGMLAYSAALWYEFYKVIRGAKDSNTEERVDIT